MAFTNNKFRDFQNPKALHGLRRGGLAMSIDCLVLFFDGILVLVSLVLSQLLHPYWLWFTALLGGMMIQAAFTGFCPIARTLKAMGVKSGPAFK